MSLSVDRPAHPEADAPSRRSRRHRAPQSRLSPSHLLSRVGIGHWFDLTAAAGFLALAVTVMRPLWASPKTLVPAQNHSDPVWFQWMLLHAVRIFTHGENPFRAPQMGVPTGVNLLANTHALGLTIPAAPVTVLFGPAAAFVFLITAGLAGTAYAWYHVLSRHLLPAMAPQSAGRGMPAWMPDVRIGGLVGGLICGFGPGMIAHASGHPNITAQFVIPFIVWRSLALGTTRRPWRDGAILGLLVAYQAMINEELLLDTGIALVIFVLAYTIFRPSSIRRYSLRMLRGLGVTMLVAVPLLAYPLWLQFTGPGHVKGLPAAQQRFPFTLPLTTYLRLPTLSTWGDPWANHTLAHLPEENSFFGIPLLAVALVAVIVLWRRSAAIRAMLVVALLFAWASLGNRVIVSTPHLTYPYSLWSHLSGLPVFSSVLPTRLALVVLVVSGIAVAAVTAAGLRALILGRPRRRWAPWAKRIVAVAVLLSVVGTLVTLAPRPIPVAAAQEAPQFFRDGTYKQYVPEGYSVLPATPNQYTYAMSWSIATGLEMPIVGGYFLGPDSVGRTRFGPPDRKTTTLLRALSAGYSHTKPALATRQNAVADLRYWHVAIVVLAPGSPNELTIMAGLNALFGPVRWVDGVWLWQVQPITDGTATTYRGEAGLAGRSPPMSLR